MASLVLMATLLAALAVTPSASWAQENSGEGEVLTRYDSEATKQLAAEYDALLQEREEYLAENETASWNIDDESNALADSRLRDIESAPVPSEEEKRARVEELRRQAEALYALQTWADDVGVNVQSDVYYGGAERIAEDYEEEAETLEEEAAEEEAAAEETTTPGTTEAAAGQSPSGSEETPGGDETPAEEPPSEKLEGSGSGGDAGDGSPTGSPAGGLSLGTLLLIAAVGLGVVVYGLSVFSRQAVGRKLSGAWRARFGAMQATAGAASKKPPEPPREEPRQEPQRPPGEESSGTTENSGSAMAAPGESKGVEGGEVPPRASQPRTKGHREATDSEANDTSSLDDETLAEWFAQEMSEESGEEPKKESQRSERRKKRRGDSGDTPEEARETPKKAPATKPDLNEIVDEQLGAMWEAGELGPMDKVEVRIEDGKIVVRKKE